MLRGVRVGLLAVGMLALGQVVHSESAAAADPATGRFVSLTPTRAIDTRSVPGTTTAERVVVAGRFGVPADAIAVALTVTATASTGPGFVTVYPSGVARPLASNLNLERADQTIANMVVVGVGVGGAVEVFSSAPLELVVDVVGAWVPSEATTAGRLLAASPRRLLDTRSAGKLAAGSTTSVAVGAGASAAVLNVTATDASGFGYVTAYASGTPRPLASNLNTDHAGQTIANLVIAPVGADGRVELFTFAPTHLIVDLLGTFTDSGASAGTTGLFRPTVPRRLVDTRSADPLPRLRSAIAQGFIVGDGSAAFVNVTATEAPRPGYVTVWPAYVPRPVASNLNIDRTWQTIPNLTLTALGVGGTASLFADQGGHFIVDLAGTFTGPPVALEPFVLDDIEWPPPSQGILRQVAVVGGDITPKSVVSTGSGLFFAQNMMYSHTITVYDRSGALVRTIDDRVNGVRGAPVEATAHPNGRWMYVSNYSMYGPGEGPEGFDACTPASNVGDSTVYRVDIGSLAIDQVIPVGRVPKYLAVSPDGRWLVVTNWCSWDVSIIDTSTGREVGRSPVLGRYPRGIVIDPTSSTAYVALMGQGDVVAVDLKTAKVVRTMANVGGGPRHLNLSPDGSTLYVTLNEDGGVAKLDVASGRVTARVATGNQPRSAALAGDGANLFVVNYESASVSKVRTDTMTVVQEVGTSYHPIGITYDDESRQLWVACYVGRLHIFDNR
jgi:YVTN family beta-propeller protein